MELPIAHYIAHTIGHWMGWLLVIVATAYATIHYFDK